jgi:YD repeat-containing protein
MLELDEHGLPISYVSEILFDAINRIVYKKQTDNSIHQYKYHKSGLLKSVQVQLSVPFDISIDYVKDIQYNAKGQRVSILYGNNTITSYSYERDTFRLDTLKTHRSSDSPSKLLQDLSYVYDPVGNITSIKDNSHRTIFRKQAKIEPVSTFEYDSLYRLTRADGRQHPAAIAIDHKNPTAYKLSHYLSIDSVSINDSTELEPYSEKYHYDFAGNLEKIIHSVPLSSSSHGWTRTQTFADFSDRIQSSKVSNRIEHPADLFSYDSAGNMTKLENIREINWNYRNNISSVVLVGPTGDSSEKPTEYYVHDFNGLRVKKVMESYRKVDGQIKFVDIKQKTYLDGYEIKQIKSFELVTKEFNISLERYSCHVVDNHKRTAILHR